MKVYVVTGGNLYDDHEDFYILGVFASKEDACKKYTETNNLDWVNIEQHEVK